MMEAAMNQTIFINPKLENKAMENTKLQNKSPK